MTKIVLYINTEKIKQWKQRNTNGQIWSNKAV